MLVVLYTIGTNRIGYQSARVRCLKHWQKQQTLILLSMVFILFAILRNQIADCLFWLLSYKIVLF